MGKTIIIGEAGVNHNGEMWLAKKLVDVAADAGVDYVKFQTFKADDLVSKNSEKADYQKLQTGTKESHYEMIKKLELSYKDHAELINYCKYKNIKFLSAPFDIKSVDLLVDLGLNLLKIPSGEVTNLPFLEHVAKTGKYVILSTGMCYLDEIEDSIKILYLNGLTKNKLSILHCNTEYPTPFEDVNLNAMIEIKEKFGIDIGYSDHTAGITVPIAAVSMGAKIIEKHFTVDSNLPGPDHKASLEPNELKKMVNSIRDIEKALGSNKKTPSPSEEKNIAIARKSLVAKSSISKGDIFNIENITTKRPGTGISPMRWYEYLGKKSNFNYNLDDLIKDQ